MLKTPVKCLCAVALASVVLAQDIYIAQPPAHTNIIAGSDITVQLDRPLTLTGSEEVAVVIGISPCTSVFTCKDVTEILGEVLYNGPYAPALHDDAWDPYQNITVAVPTGYSGPCQLGVAHFFLLGAGPGPQLQTTSTTLNVVASG